MSTMPLGMVADAVRDAILGAPRALRLLDPDAQRRASPHDPARIEAARWDGMCIAEREPRTHRAQPKPRPRNDWRKRVCAIVERDGAAKLSAIVKYGLLACEVRKSIELGEWPGYRIDWRRGRRGKAAAWVVKVAAGGLRRPHPKGAAA